ncbi:G5 domain-containing protein [Curtobacterium flaccumfaciens pv. flaccumfaciens]
MLMMIALVILPTMLYAVAFRRSTWLRIPRKRATAAISAGIALAALIGSTSAYGASHPLPDAPATVAAAKTSSATVSAKPKTSPTPTRTVTPTPTPSPTPVVTTKQVTETAQIPFGSTTVESSTLAQGTSTVTTPGAQGINTKTYTVTYTDGVESGRVLTSEHVTTPPVTQVTTVGTYVAPRTSRSADVLERHLRQLRRRHGLSA